MGCMHMTCSNPCRHEFCWLCLGPRRQHVNCQRYAQDKPDGGELTKDEARRLQAKASLDRYLYCCERCAANAASLKKVRKDMNDLERTELQALADAVRLPVTKLQFLTEAYEQIADCRRVLRWTYAYGYYLDPEVNMAKLFEYLQEQAESPLERLHDCAERERKELSGKDEDAIAEMYEPFREKLTNLHQSDAKLLRAS